MMDLATECPCCGASDADTLYARACLRAEAQTNDHQPLPHTVSRVPKRHKIAYTAEDRAQFIADARCSDGHRRVSG